MTEIEMGFCKFPPFLKIRPSSQSRNFAQGLKPRHSMLCAVCGPAEAVPFYKTLRVRIRQTLPHWHQKAPFMPLKI